jgi:Domain of unknown function (DUF4126)
MDFVSTIALAMGASWVSGINLYATVATLGLLGRFANLRLPGELEVLTDWWVIAIALVLYLIEFLADKIPLVDSTWDAIHTFIRVPAGAILAAGAFGDFDKGVQVVALLLGGGLALSSHGTKAAARAMINTSPEPVSNVVASTAEDIVAIGSVILAAFAPLILFIVVATGVIVSLIVLPKIIRYLRGIFGRTREKAKAAKPM